MEDLKNDLEMKAEISLYYDLFVPENVSEKAPLLITIHGYGAHKRYMMKEARLVAPQNFVIASLQGPHQHFHRIDDGYRVGFGWLTEHKPEEYIRLHHKFVLDVIDKLASERLIDRDQIYMHGFSQACALNFRFAFTYPDVLKSIIAISGGIPSDLDTNSIYKPFAAKTLYLYGDTDEFYPLEKFTEFDAKLAKRLPNYRSKQFQAKHEITDEMRAETRDFLREV
jgi:phospholipase/carboxylesterase